MYQKRERVGSYTQTLVENSFLFCFFLCLKIVLNTRFIRALFFWIAFYVDLFENYFQVRFWHKIPISYFVCIYFLNIAMSLNYQHICFEILSLPEFCFGDAQDIHLLKLLYNWYNSCTVQNDEKKNHNSLYLFECFYLFTASIWYALSIVSILW